MIPPYAILDSSIYIDHWESRRFAEQLHFVSQRFLISQCSVVLHELRRGAKTKQAIRLVENLLRSSDEIINPTDTEWWRAAQWLSRFLAQGKIPKARLKNLQNDCLIAFCAKRIGAVVVTSDKKDFPLLERSLPCRVLYW